MDDAHNWLDGRWQPALSNERFTIAGAGAAESRGWPRSGASDAHAALQAAAQATASWRRLDARARIAALERVEHALARGPDPDGGIAAALGLESAELASRHADLDDVLRVALQEPVDARADLVIVAPHWTELVRDPARDVLRALASGACVIAMSDPHLPHALHAIATAIAGAELPAGVFALLHDDGETTLAALLATQSPGAADRELRACGTRERVRRMRTLAERGGASLSTALVELRNRTHVVRGHEDLQAAAQHVLDAAFGRSTALSGQAPGQVGRVVCHERSFSRFTSELLAAFDASMAPAIAIRESTTTLHGTRARDLGLDEGTTLLRTGASRTDPSCNEPGTSALPLVFTNVEEHMRLAALSRPAPVLCLMRATSDAAADELQERLDGNPAAEDLAAH